METLSNILASFDIFQVLFSAFPMITEPFVHAFEQVFSILSEFFRGFFVSHPGLSLGIFVLTVGYATVYLTGEVRRYITVKISRSKKRIG